MTEQLDSGSVSGHTHIDALRPGERLAEFEILGLLGVGGFGMVYKAFDHSLHRSVAIKEYMPSALVGRVPGEQSLTVRSSSDASGYRAGLVSFVEEARVLAQFDHPSLVKVFRFWEANNTAYMVMPLYMGMTLKQARVHMSSPPPEAWLRSVLWSVLSALRLLHDAQMLHRDISPDNIFLQYNGPPVLLDLGAARYAISDPHRKNTAVLKVNYAPIEQYAEDDSDLRAGPWSDLYSLGAVVYGCLCNDTPAPSTVRIIRDRISPLPRVAKTIESQFGVSYGPAFVDAIQQAFAVRPDDRPQTIDALLQIMQMTSPPPGVAHFDFRKDLGATWAAPADHLHSDVDLLMVNVTSPSQIHRSPENPVQGSAVMVYGSSDYEDEQEYDSRDNPETVVLEYGADDADFHKLASKPAASRERKPGVAQMALAYARLVPALGWALGALIAAVLVAAIAWKHSQAPAVPDPSIRAIAATQPVPVPEPTSVALVQTPSPEAILEEVVAAERAAAANAPAAVQQQPPHVANAPATVPVAAPAVENRDDNLLRKRVDPTVSGRKKSNAAAAPETFRPPEPVVVAPVMVEPAPAPPVPKPVPKPVNPNETCAKENFLTRPMCVHHECQKSLNASHPVCLENRRRFEAEEQRRRQSSTF